MAKSKLEINGLNLEIKLGLTEEERLKPQNVEFYISIEFDIIPMACNSDIIEETICYDDLVKLIKNFCEDKEFKLIEYLCHSLYQYFKTIYLKQEIKLKICKNPPIKEIHGNCCFSIY